MVVGPSCCTRGRRNSDLHGFSAPPPINVSGFTALGAGNPQHCPDQHGWRLTMEGLVLAITAGHQFHSMSKPDDSAAMRVDPGLFPGVTDEHLASRLSGTQSSSNAAGMAQPDGFPPAPSPKGGRKNITSTHHSQITGVTRHVRLGDDLTQHSRLETAEGENPQPDHARAQLPCESTAPGLSRASPQTFRVSGRRSAVNTSLGKRRVTRHRLRTTSGA